MKYCSLDEAWGTNFENKDGCDVYFQHKKNLKKIDLQIHLIHTIIVKKNYHLVI